MKSTGAALPHFAHSSRIEQSAAPSFPASPDQEFPQLSTGTSRQEHRILIG